MFVFRQIWREACHSAGVGLAENSLIFVWDGILNPVVQCLDCTPRCFDSIVKLFRELK